MKLDISTRNNTDESAYDVLPIGIIKTDIDGNILYVNKSFANSSGYSINELIGKNPNVLKSGEMIDSFYKEMWDTISLSNDWAGRICNKKKNGTFYWQELKIHPIIHNNKIQHYVGVAVDVTKDVLSVESLTEKSMITDKMFALIPNIVYIFDVIENRSVYYNKMLSTLTGYNSFELNDNKDSMIELLIHPDDISKFLNHMETIKNSDILKKTNQIYSLEYRLVGKYGDIINIIDKQIPFKYDSNGKVEQILGVVIDITDIKEKHLIIQQSNEIKDRLMSIIAHDVKNPFQAVVGYSELLLHSFKTGSEEDLIYYLTKISESIFNIDELLNNLISWARLNTLKPNKIKIKLHEFVEYIIGKYQNSCNIKNINISIDIPTDIYIYADEYMVYSIISNFITNSIKFTNSGGNISIVTKLLQNSERVLFEVKDDGIGMNEDILHTLRDKNYISNITIGTDGEKGTGLGLSICKEFIKKHDGRLTIDSKLGYGTSIKFDLPGFKKNIGVL